jgi:group I intron endonuclease
MGAIRICGIYRITNVVNRKCYVGRADNIKRRWSVHRCMLNKSKHKNTPLQNAWNKYGEDNFIFEVLEECIEDRLQEREFYWVEFFHALDRSFGYNIEIPSSPQQTSLDTRRKISMAVSGENSPHAKLTWEKVLEIREKYLTRTHSQQKLADVYGVTRTNIQAIIENRAWRDVFYNIPGFVGAVNREVKLDIHKAAEIRNRYCSGKYSQKELALEYGVSFLVIQRTVRNMIWKDSAYIVPENILREHARGRFSR